MLKLNKGGAISVTTKDFVISIALASIGDSFNGNFWLKISKDFSPAEGNAYEENDHCPEFLQR